MTDEAPPSEALPPELERRIAALEDDGGEGRGLTRDCWMWFVVLGLVVPALLLVWGWRA